jgi:hypothetical protein
VHDVDGATTVWSALVVVDGLAMGEDWVSGFAKLLNASGRVNNIEFVSGGERIDRADLQPLKQASALGIGGHVAQALIRAAISHEALFSR